ncbi:MAG: 2-hydroxyacyl-CoA dehydratase [Deltaproteobacteria bacterium]|nr:2-hydroxyacyl-CoA dehydratase [Deltaproteobacteria bacterium]
MDAADSMKATSKSEKSLHASNEVFSHVLSYYKRAHEAKAKKTTKIVYHTGLDPVEIDYAMGLIPMFPENFSAACGAMQLAQPLIEASESMNAPEDLCSYFKTHYGFMKGEFPESLHKALSRIRLPEPDLVVACMNLCRLHPLWMKITAEHYGVPYFSIDAPVVPPRYDQNPLVYDTQWGNQVKHALGKEAIAYGVAQLKEYISFLEEHTAQKMDYERLRDAVAHSARMGEHFREIFELRKNVPCPAGGEDLNTLVFFAVTMAGTPEAADFYARVVDEIRQRVAEGRGVLENERFRLLFDGIPPWFNMGLFNYFHKFGAISVDEMYPETWCAALDPSNPLESLAVKYMLLMAHTASYRAFAEYSQDRVREYKVDGAILWNLRTCRMISTTYVPRAQATLEQDCGVPVLVLDADQVDPRRFSAAQILNRIDAFMEMLEQKKYG